MKTTKESLIVLVLVLALFVLSTGCINRTAIDGNSTNETDIIGPEQVDAEDAVDTGTEEVEVTPMEASKIRSEYDGARFVDCGVYLRRNNADANEGDYASIYKCFSEAVDECREAKAFVDVQTPEGARVVSFLSTANCKITNHIKGNDPFGYSGEKMKTCEDINPNLALQYACMGYEI